MALKIELGTRMNRRIGALAIAVAMLSGCEVVDSQMDVRRAKSEVSGAMLDPSSADFRGIRHATYGSSRVVCGEVNGNNAFGAKAGFRRFMYVDPLMRIASDERSAYAIYQCCKSLLDTGKVGGVKTTADVAECSGVEPAMPLI